MDSSSVAYPVPQQSAEVTNLIALFAAASWVLRRACIFEGRLTFKSAFWRVNKPRFCYSDAWSVEAAHCN